ncbi:hypothetical protein [Inconstantimicrobium porci]|uniref:hypothetical protein n=1 Tax=Inconstantimicrobium porci TaxID=2652291 RepID=UPI00240A2C2C|nr:hypothetical protein [Inconstantimicrobium porci]MDD6770649.1 hypothetical protein [Inconstantimicrobium porci]
MNKVLWSLNGIIQMVQAAQTSEMYDEKTQDLFWLLGQELERDVKRINKIIEKQN